MPSIGGLEGRSVEGLVEWGVHVVDLRVMHRGWYVLGEVQRYACIEGRFSHEFTISAPAKMYMHAQNAVFG